MSDVTLQVIQLASHFIPYSSILMFVKKVS